MTEHTDLSTGEHPAGGPGDQPGMPTPTAYNKPVAPPAAYNGPAAEHTNTLAIVALVTGFCCNIAAVITGHIALSQIRRTGEAGKGFAIAGLVLGYVSMGLTALLLVMMVFFTATVGAFVAAVAGASSSATSSESSSAEPTGQTGAAYFDDGFLLVGTGSTVVDLYIDPMCPFCGQFDIANGDTLAALVDDGSITMRLHALTFLDHTSQGTEYSTRASAALTCEAAINPESTLDYLAALFANQPAEGTTGLSDDELVALSGGGSSIAECVTDERYHTWSQQNTEAALNGPIPGAEIASIQGTPTVLIDGSQYNGPIDDPQALADAILGVTS